MIRHPERNPPLAADSRCQFRVRADSVLQSDFRDGKR
jgi:hypothetical protein